MLVPTWTRVSGRFESTVQKREEIALKIALKIARLFTSQTLLWYGFYPHTSTHGNVMTKSRAYFEQRPEIAAISKSAVDEFIAIAALHRTARRSSAFTSLSCG